MVFFSCKASFFKLIGFLAILAIAPDSTGDVFKCVDKSTGKMTFTDHACPNDQLGQTQGVRPANSDSGYDGKVARKAMDGGTSNKNNSASQQNKSKYKSEYQNRNEYIKSKRQEREQGK